MRGPGSGVSFGGSAYCAAWRRYDMLLKPRYIETRPSRVAGGVTALPVGSIATQCTAAERNHTHLVCQPPAESGPEPRGFLLAVMKSEQSPAARELGESEQLLA